MMRFLMPWYIQEVTRVGETCSLDDEAHVHKCWIFCDTVKTLCYNSLAKYSSVIWLLLPFWAKNLIMIFLNYDSPSSKSNISKEWYITLLNVWSLNLLQHYQYMLIPLPIITFMVAMKLYISLPCQVNTFIFVRDNASCNWWRTCFI